MTSEDLDWEVLRKSHSSEARERLDTIERALLDIEAGEEALPLLDILQREVHTLKGNAGLFDFGALVALAHAYEDGLEAVRSRAHDADWLRTALPPLFGGLDRLRAVLDASQSGDQLFGEDKALAESLRRLGSLTIGTGSERRDAGPAAGSLKTRTDRDFLRVDLRRIDRLVELASELSVVKGRVADVLLRETLSDASRETIETALDLIDAVSELSLRMRLVALDPTLQAQRRSARDASRAIGNNVTLSVSGGDVEIDLSLVETLREALGHLVRNAVAHGIETTAERLKAGKEAVGRISIRALQEPSQVVVEVEDDGRGLQTERIRDRAAALGLSGQGLADTREAAELIFQPGLSTAAEVTDVAGRGVGLNAVRASIERVGGSITLESRPGQGTTFRIRLPLTLAVLNGLTVEVGSETLVIPMALITECARIPLGRSTEVVRGVFTALHGGRTLPVVRLSEFLFNRKGAKTESMVVVDQPGLRVGFFVDQLGTAQRVVVRSIPGALDHATSIFGAAILGNGRVALILDVHDIVRRAAAAEEADDDDAPRKTSTAGKRHHR